jgi:hypothetical protein
MNCLKIRGLHIDPARRPLSIDIITKIIEGLDENVINTLHIHLTDDQGITMNSNVLHFKGGWTINETKKIYEMCRKKGIDIIPEIDIPGHTVAIRSILNNAKYKPEEKMGTITSGLIELNQLPIILKMYDEVYDVFKPKYFHMGGDETRGTNTKYFTQLIKEVCDWGKIKGIKIIAWEDVLMKIKKEDIPDNLIIQKWKARSYPPIAQAIEHIGFGRVINSVGYYLDTCIDPYTAYRKKINSNWLGCIACTWGELIGEENILDMIFPTINVFGVRWSHLLSNDNPNEIFLRYQKISSFDLSIKNSWKRRQWRGFVLKTSEKIPSRSSSSILTTTKMIREEDKYPLISNTLINLTELFMNYMKREMNESDEKLDMYKNILMMSIKDDENKRNTAIKIISQLFELLKGDKTSEYEVIQYKKLLRQLRNCTEDEEQDTYKNGIRMVIRECLR